jgi:hypothetical protein
MMMKKLLLCGPVLALLLITACSNGLSYEGGGGPSTEGRYVSDKFGNQYILPYSPYNYKVALSEFVPAANGVSNVITADKKLNEAVWAASHSYPVREFKNGANTTGTQDPAPGYSTEGALRSVWDGYTLYLAVDVIDNTPSYLNGLEASTERMTSFTGSPGPGNWHQFDSVEFYINFLGDKYEGRTMNAGTAKISRSGKFGGIRWTLGNNDETWADSLGQPEAREFQDRAKDWGAYETASGYTAWIAFEIWQGADPYNGVSFGLEVKITDSPSDGAASTGRTYWSHYDNSYTYGNDTAGRLDEGSIVLVGHTAPANSDFANSDWMLTNPIRWAKGDPWWPRPGAAYLINLPDTVQNSWTPESWARLQSAIDAGRELLTGAPDQWARPHVDWALYDQAEVKTRAQAVEAAIVSLQWADDVIGATRLDAPPLNTLPDPLLFKTDGNFGDGVAIPGLAGRKGTYVNSYEDWLLRVREIKALAAIYEYGPIPEGPKIHSVEIQSTPGVEAHWELPGWWIVGGVPNRVEATDGAYTIVATYTYDGTEGASWDGTNDTRIPGLNAMPGTVTNAYQIVFPTAAQKAAGGLPAGQGVPLSINFNDGGSTTHRALGIATLNVPANVTTDARGNGVWQTRSGTFRNFFPYLGRGQRYEFSNEMGSAWAVSRAIDALYDAKDIPLVSRNITITNIQSSADFKLGDRLYDGVTYWTVGLLDAPENPEGQSGTGHIGMLYLEAGAIPPTESHQVTFGPFETFVSNGEYATVSRGSATATVTVGDSIPDPQGRTIANVVDYNKIATAGFSINGKYAFVAQVFDDRVNVGIPGAAGATGPQTWRYDAKGNEYAWGNPGGVERIIDNNLANPGRANETFRRFLTLFRYSEYLRGIDINGDFSHGFAERLPFDNHELVAALYPRAVIERNTNNDYNDGSEADAISFQAARMVYRFLIDKGFGEHKTGAGRDAAAEDLVKFNYRLTGGHGADTIQYEREAAYLAWYFYDKPMNAAFADHMNFDPFYNDVLVSGGSNSYERHYGGFKVMMPWPWVAPYYPK